MTNAPECPKKATLLRNHEGLRIIGTETISFLMEIWSFMLERKKFWLLPILFAMVLLGGLVVLTKGSPVAPFIYTLFWSPWLGPSAGNGASISRPCCFLWR